jgi:hypothetical protein
MKGISRRNFVAAAASVFGAAVLDPAYPQAQPPADYADVPAADRWIKSWADHKRALLGALNLFRFADPTYAVLKEITWTPNAPQQPDYKPVAVPPGFVTDLASIPRVFWSALRPDGDYAYAAIVHDFLYWMQPVPRERADEIFRLAMQDLGVGSATVEVIHAAVRGGGGGAWTNNARLKASGEKRILKRFPDDPTVRWEVWKQTPDVFA